MTISSIGSTLLSSLSAANSSSSNPSNSIDSALLSTLSQTSGGASDPLLSAIVSLGSQSGATSTTYNAQGLLSFVQSSAADPLLQSGSSASDSNSGDVQSAVLQAAVAQNGSGSTTTSATSSGTQAASSSSYSTGTSSAELTNNWALMLKQNPALAGDLVTSQVEQNLINLIG